MNIKKYLEFISEEKTIPVEIPIPDDIKRISDAYIKAGKDIFVVGGAIRDFLQGKTPHDYDLVTNALPDESKRILHGFKVSDEQGKNFGVLRVYTKDEPLGYEIASFRRDISHGRDTKGNDQKGEIGNNITIEDDSNRRDISINSLYYNINKKEIIDLVGGVDDIKNKIIRAVGDPKERFIEDRLRILRIFRFSTRTGSEIDKATSDAIKQDNRLRDIGPKDNVSQERIYEELVKSWDQVKDYTHYLNLLTEFNMWNQIFPGSNINTNFVKSSNFIITITSLFKNENPNGLRKKLVELYKIPDNISTKVEFLITLLNLTSENITEMYKKKIQCGINNETILEWYKVNKIHDNIFNKFIEYKPSVSAQLLMDKGFKGSNLGNEIKRLEIEKFKEML